MSIHDPLRIISLRMIRATIHLDPPFFSRFSARRTFDNLVVRQRDGEDTFVYEVQRVPLVVYHLYVHGYVESQADPMGTLAEEIQDIRVDIALEQAGFAIAPPHQETIEPCARIFADLVQPFCV